MTDHYASDRCFISSLDSDTEIRQAATHLRVAAWDKMPKGWTEDSVKKFWKSLTGEAKHKVTKCIEKMKDTFDDPGGFCASIADIVDPGWRSRPRKASRGVTISVNELPPIVLEALRSVHYGRRDIEVSPKSSYSVSAASGDGSQAFTIAVNLKTNRFQIEKGSWGGANIFNPRNPVDLDDAPRSLPPNSVIIQGHESSRPTFAHIYVHPSNMPLFISDTGETLTKEEQKAINIISGIMSGYRQKEFLREDLGNYKADNPLIQSLAQKGLVKITGSGIKITIKGQNHRKRAALKIAKADVTPVRQRSQYSCVTSSLTMCLRAHGIDTNEDEVNKVLGASPMQGASWEQAFAAAQHYGMRITFICPATLKQVKEYTDAGIPVMIAWNPEGRPWGHASVIFDVKDDVVYVADPNIPDPEETVRKIPKTEFYGKWYEKFNDYLVRRPAMTVEREITPEGKQTK